MSTAVNFVIALESLDTDRESLDTDRESLDTDRESLDTDKESLDTDRESLDTDKESLDTDRESLDTDKESLDTDKESLDTDRESLDTDRESLDTDRESLDTDRESLDTDRDRGAGALVVVNNIYHHNRECYLKKQSSCPLFEGWELSNGDAGSRLKHQIVDLDRQASLSGFEIKFLLLVQLTTRSRSSQEIRARFHFCLSVVLWWFRVYLSTRDTTHDLP